jgi:acyl CoA:acetate/3-ketoacid CoA transferase beta subunit
LHEFALQCWRLIRETKKKRDGAISYHHRGSDGAAWPIAARAAPLTSARPVSMVVSELAVIDLPQGRARLLEVAPGVAVEQVLANTQANLILPSHVPTMAI